MLKGIPPVISPALLKALAEMGHGDEIVIADAHFPAVSCNRDALRADGVPATELVAGVFALMALDTYDTPVVMMAPEPCDTLDPAVEAGYRQALGGYAGPVARLSRADFYDRARQAFAIVQSGTAAPYANIILKKGNA